MPNLETYGQALLRWATAKLGRPPQMPAEVGAAYAEETFRINPAQRRKRDLVVAYAREKGGRTEEITRVLFPQYFGDLAKPDYVGLRAKIETMGMSKEEFDSLRHAIDSDLAERWMQSLKENPPTRQELADAKRKPQIPGVDLEDVKRQTHRAIQRRRRK